MSFWSKLFSNDVDSVKESYQDKTLENASYEENVSSNLNYGQFDEQPGKSISFLNNDAKWNRFIQYESENDGELVARFKCAEFKKFFLNYAYEEGIISSIDIEKDCIYETNFFINEISTTYMNWATKNEPVICIDARIYSQFSKGSLFEYKFLVRAPYEGYLRIVSSFWEDIEVNGENLYILYSPSRAKELWPHFEQYGFIYDNPDELDHVNVRFNEYKYDEEFWKGIPYYAFETENNFVFLRYEWKVANFSHVSKDQHVCTIIKNPNFYNQKEYKIYSPASGVITLSRNGESKDYKCEEEIRNCNELHLFSVYKDRASLMKHHFYFYDRQKIDEFDGTISLSWVTDRRLPKCEEDESYLDDYPGVEMSAGFGNYIIVSFELKNNIPYIVFSVDSNKIRLSNGDFLDMQFVGDNGDNIVLKFPITNNCIAKRVSNVYDKSFYCELSQDDIFCMMNYDCVSWRARFSKQPLMTVVGSNESIWCPKEYAVDVFKAFAKRYMELIEELRIEHTIEFSSSNDDSTYIVSDDACYVYLMLDTSTGYYKIGMSNNPEYRERTLQSEKPTIVKLCAKEFPNRAIAGAFESALHKTFESKRLRGEWFELDDNDITAIIMSLS